jgi:hypothetical protein
MSYSPADLTEHEPVLDKVIALRAGHRLGGRCLDMARQLVRDRIALGRGGEGPNAILDWP